MFNNFERGAFFVSAELLSESAHVLSTRTNSSFLTYYNGSLYGYGSGNTAGNVSKQPVSDPVIRWGVSWDSNSPSRVECLNGLPPKYPPHGGWHVNDLAIALTGSVWIKAIGFNDSLSPDELQRLTVVPRRTTIASGQILGDYDPNERLSLFKDRHGITPVERDGDPVRFMLDLGPAGNHLQAAPESTGLIYRTDGERAWIEYNGENDYFQYRAGPILRGDIAVSAHIAAWLDHVSGPAYRKILAQGTYQKADSEFFVGWADENRFHGSVGYEQPEFSANAPSDIQRKWFALAFNSVNQGTMSLVLNSSVIGSTDAFDNGGYTKSSSFFMGRDGFNGIVTGKHFL